MTVADHDELTVTVTGVPAFGYFVRMPDGAEGFIDQAKVPAWNGDGPPPVVGDKLFVVVLDETRSPCRLSALPLDFTIARSLSGPS